jgi:hypothetical protein
LIRAFLNWGVLKLRIKASRPMSLDI